MKNASNSAKWDRIAWNLRNLGFRRTSLRCLTLKIGSWCMKLTNDGESTRLVLDYHGISASSHIFEYHVQRCVKYRDSQRSRHHRVRELCSNNCGLEILGWNRTDSYGGSSYRRHMWIKSVGLDLVDQRARWHWSVVPEKRKRHKRWRSHHSVNTQIPRDGDRWQSFKGHMWQSGENSWHFLTDRAK